MAEKQPTSWLDALPQMQRLYKREQSTWSLEDWRACAHFHEAAANDFKNSAMEACRELVNWREQALLWRQLAASFGSATKGRPLRTQQRQLLKTLQAPKRSGRPATVPMGLVEFITREMQSDHTVGTKHSTREWVDAAVRVYERIQGQPAPFSGSTLANLLVGKNPAAKRSRKHRFSKEAATEIERAFSRFRRCS